MLNPLVNPNFRVHWDGPLLVVDDFLLNIDEFREQLRARGHFHHHQSNKSVVDVGPVHEWRQILASAEFPADFVSSVARLQHVDEPATHYGTNLFYSDMKIEKRRHRASHFPHTDHVEGRGPLPIVFNLWLHDGGGGTGFYTCDGHYASTSMSAEHRYFIENYNPLGTDVDGVMPFQNDFQGDDVWRLWKLAEMKKNRAFVYCGDLWHRVLIANGEFQYPEARFSFVCFSTAPSQRFLEASDSRQYLQNSIFPSSISKEFESKGSS